MGGAAEKRGGWMSKKLVLLGATFAVSLVAVLALGVSVASAGEVTGNCNHAEAGSPADANCKGLDPDPRVANGNSWCSYSGQNDNPASTDPMNPGGKVQNWGHTSNPENREFLTSLGLNPGAACNPNNTTFGGGAPPPRK
jgi:hypothetical protein